MQIRARFLELTDAQVAVIIGDTSGRTWRVVSLGIAHGQSIGVHIRSTDQN